MRRTAIMTLTAGLFLLNPVHAMARVSTDAARSDRLYLRNGDILYGSVMNETTTDYAFIPRGDRGLKSIPRAAVRFLLYADTAKAERMLGLAAARRYCTSKQLVNADILTTPGFAKAIIEAARDAQHSIRIAAYYVSGASTGPIREFYTALMNKARQGVEVDMLIEYGRATPPSVKRASRNFAEELAQSGVRVFLLNEEKAQHKKLLIVDERVVILGSSNLTFAGTFSSNEMNVRIKNAAFARQAMRDFRGLRKLAVPLEQWKE